MPGLVYIDTNSSTVMLTDAKYFDCPAQYKKLRIRTGTGVSETIGYPLTSDTSASQYSPVAIMYTNSSVCYIGTYSTGSSSASGSYTYIAQSGYEKVVTRVEAVTERRTGNGSYTYQSSGTQQYIHHTEGTPGESYYSIRGSSSQTAKATMHDGDKQSDVQGFNQAYHDYPIGYIIFDRKTDNRANENGKVVDLGSNVGVYNVSGKTTTSYVNKNNSSDWTLTHHVRQRIDWVGNNNYNDRYNSAHVNKATTSYYTTSIYGYVSRSGSTRTVYSTSTTYTTLTSQTQGVYTATLYYTSYYSSRYTQRTSSSSRSGGEVWTHSNINIL